jgi:hypothetical protein
VWKRRTTAVKHKHDKLPHFTTWLRQQCERQDNVGALARKVYNDPAWPRMQHFSSFLTYMVTLVADTNGAQDAPCSKPYSDEDVHALYKAWEECVRAIHGKRAWLSWKVSKMWDHCPTCQDILVTPYDYVKYRNEGTTSIALIYRCHHCFRMWRYDWPMTTFEQFNVEDVPVSAYAQ